MRFLAAIRMTFLGVLDLAGTIWRGRGGGGLVVKGVSGRWGGGLGVEKSPGAGVGMDWSGLSGWLSFPSSLVGPSQLLRKANFPKRR